MKVKTYKQWQKANVDLDLFLTTPCEIDEELALYIGEIVAPQYCSQHFTQKGESDFERHGIDYFMSVSHIDGRHFYLGILPEFKQ